MSSAEKVFDNQDIMREIFSYYPKRCGSCHQVMKRKFLDHKNPAVYNFYNLTWRKTENEFCKGYCNWCCKYVFNHPY